jgi:membrane-associated phospholipid phosphatase
MESLDLFWFQWINQLNIPEWVQTILIYSRSPSTWIPLYILLIFWLFFKIKKKAILILLTVGFSVGFSDFTNSKLLKQAFDRDRPCHVLEVEQIKLRVTCGSGRSMPSTHAANHMNLAIMVMLFFRKFQLPGSWILIPWALMIGLAQVYVGVHYPTDIIVGFIWGGVIGYSFYRLYCSLFAPSNT